MSHDVQSVHFALDTLRIVAATKMIKNEHGDWDYFYSRYELPADLTYDDASWPQWHKTYDLDDDLIFLGESLTEIEGLIGGTQLQYVHTSISAQLC